MLIITVFVSTPTRQADFMVKMVDFLTPGDMQDVMTSAMVIEVLSITLTNSIIIPQIVYFFSEFLFYETRTQKDVSKIFKYFLFLFINAIVLPITRISQIVDFI